ncbi:hypothetical protein [Nocardia sp. NBC_01327]|uniref:hypothetical protein n=1 Tax=Nocardia sp. NBC_01327 TaxID=2903593 RepID=UPI002E0E211A|nr:hypothetical protein OG326_24040 [Nocardia sp. NBC_01327]
MTATATVKRCTDPKCGRQTHRPLRRGVCNACYGRQRRRQTAYGRWENGRSDVAPVRAHIIALKAAGVSYRRIAALAGIHRTVVESVIRGNGKNDPLKWVHKDTATAILAVAAATGLRRPPGDGDAVTSLGTRRRLQALVAAGWPMWRLAEELDTAPTNVSSLIRHRPMVTKARHQRVVELFDQLHMTPGPSASARRYGLAQGWALPMQWDEEDLDNPQALPVRGSRSATRAAVPA